MYDDEGMTAEESARLDLSYLGDLSQLLMDARSGHFDEVYIALPMTAAREIRDTIEGLAASGDECSPTN